MRTLSLATSLVLAGIVATPAVAADDFFEFLDVGAGAVEIEGDGEVPLLRGVDTDARPAVLAQGPDKDEPDEFLLHVRMLAGQSHCTEAVVKALGGEVDTFVLGKGKRRGGIFGPSEKKTNKAASIPELRLKGDNGQVILKDWHCMIHATDNAISIATLGDTAVAQLTDRGVYAFAKADMADKLLAKVGEPTQATPLRGYMSYKLNSELLFTDGWGWVVQGELFGEPALLALTNDSIPTNVYGPAVTPPHTAQIGGAMHAIGPVSVGGVSLDDTMSFAIFDTQLSGSVGATEAEDIVVPGVLSVYDYPNLAIAVHPASGRVAFKKVETPVWKDPSDKFIEDAKKAYDKSGDKSASLLQPTPRAMVAAVDTEPGCDALRMVDTSFQTVDGVRAFGGSAQRFEPNECAVETRVERAEEDDEGADASDAGGDAGDAGGSDKKEAKRLADYADVLWKHGRYAEAYDLFDQAQAKADDDCSYFEDFAIKSLRMGETDNALEAAKRSSELYEPWASQDVENRILAAGGIRFGGDGPKSLPDDAVTKAQSHSCHKARGYEAMAYLAKGSHKRVEMVHAEHMDLDEQVPMALSLSRLQRGQSSRARGPALEALNVGARGSTSGHLVHGVAASRVGSERLIDANLERILVLSGHLRTGDLLVGTAIARQSTDPEKARDFLDRAVKDRPGSAGVWAAYGLDARRRGDAAALAKVKADASEIAQREIHRVAGTAGSYCEAASLMYVAGDSAAGDAFVKKAKGMAAQGSACLITDVVRNAVSGDAQASANALNTLAVRYPLHPLGTLNLLSAVPVDAGE